ncbi:Lipoxygenase [Naviculisporaceae sp. PSN 640]
MPSYATVLCLVASTSSVLASVIPEHHTVSKRSASDILNEALDKLQTAIPVVSEFGGYLYDKLLGGDSLELFTITQQSDSSLRWTNLALLRTAFLYGPPVGGGPAYPTGPLGIAKNAKDLIAIQTDLLPQTKNAYNDLKTLDDYTKLYLDEWTRVLPGGPDAGVETNYTQDLLFSMQRLANSPYQIRRLKPDGNSDTLQFTIPDHVAKAITGTTLNTLFHEGRLFYADYRDQGKLSRISGRYSAACDAYFYIHPQSGDFLPLAIRTNVGANLIYTPLDSPGDWLLAKIMYSVNDFWFAQWNHLAGTHEVVQIVWMAALRSLSHDHPVHAILDRLTLEVFSIQILAKVVLFLPFGAVDQIFPFSGRAAETYSNKQYKDGAGSFRSNYFLANLRKRGLIDSPLGPELKSFPFYEDAGAIHAAIKGFITSFVKSYYHSDADILDDEELQYWVEEATGPAKVLDFPDKIETVDSLIGVLTQIAHLVSSAHHTVNTNELLRISSTLPFCPPALYKPLPVSKSNDTNPVDYLPPLDKAFEQIVVGSLFARPHFKGTNKTIIHMFDGDFLKRTNPATRQANSLFMAKMKGFSAKVQARKFDAEGLSQGMPFIWRALDPDVAPYYVAT